MLLIITNVNNPNNLLIKIRRIHFNNYLILNAYFIFVFNQISYYELKSVYLKKTLISKINKRNRFGIST